MLWNVAAQSIGLFAGNLMGPYVSMRSYAYAGLGIGGLFLALFPLVPDSPYRYIMTGKIDEAERSLRWFRRRNDVKRELQQLQDYVQTSSVSLKDRLKELKQPSEFL